MDTRFLVVGGGLAGAAAAWRLAAGGDSVVLAEAVGLAHAGGSSHGSARIFRHAYPDPFWAALTRRALGGWQELERESGERVLTTTGGLDFGARRNLPAIAATLAAAGLEHAVLDAHDARERWPHLAFDGPVVQHSAAGVIDAERAVESMARLAERAGARIATGLRAVAVEQLSSGVLVRFDSGEQIEAEVVVLAAGAWLPQLASALPAGIGALLPELTVTQQQVFHFPFPGGPPERLQDWPVFVHKDELSVYCLPGGRDAGYAGFKIAEHDAGVVTTASGRSSRVLPEARERIVEYVRRYLPGVDPQPYNEATCLYTSTPDEDFVLDRRGDVVLVSACSGHGAKFGPLLGELAADLALRRTGPIERFALSMPVQ
jgi:sarcosine oxidase